MLLRIEVWDWDFGGDDADDLLGQFSLRGEEILTLLGSLSVEPTESAAPTNLPKEDCGRGSHGGAIEVYGAAARREAKNAGSSDSENGTGAKRPSYVCTYTLEKQAEDHERVDSEKTSKKKNKPTRSVNRVTGTVDFGICVETSKASAEATKLARKEKSARANSFKLWPLLTVANMSHNRLQGLPRGCRGWQIMTRLNLAGNLLSELPIEFCTCSKIEGERKYFFQVFCPNNYVLLQNYLC